MNIIVTSFIVAVGINLLMFIPAYLLRTDKLTDISYAVTFATVGLFGFVTSPMSLPYVLILAMVLAWSLRLGTYLLIRINKIGKDKRFDGMREDFGKFLRFWLLQGVTVGIVMLPASIFFGQTNGSVSIVSYLGIAIWLFGLSLETIADWQKYKFINDSRNKGKWIAIGVWKYSRHPNYLGEILVWVGVYIYTLPAFELSEALVALIGPGFIVFLLLFVSGIPILEKDADARWGNDPKYQKYKQDTAVLVPLM